jgi:hypothetical protein
MAGRVIASGNGLLVARGRYQVQKERDERAGTAGISPLASVRSIDYWPKVFLHKSNVMHAEVNVPFWDGSERSAVCGDRCSGSERHSNSFTRMPPRGSRRLIRPAVTRIDQGPVSLWHFRRMFPIAGVTRWARSPSASAVACFGSIARAIPWLVLMILANPTCALAGVAFRLHGFIVGCPPPCFRPR